MRPASRESGCLMCYQATEPRYETATCEACGISDRHYEIIDENGHLYCDDCHANLYWFCGDCREWVGMEDTVDLSPHYKVCYECSLFQPHTPLQVGEPVPQEDKEAA